MDNKRKADDYAIVAAPKKSKNEIAVVNSKEKALISSVSNMSL